MVDSEDLEDFGNVMRSLFQEGITETAVAKPLTGARDALFSRYEHLIEVNADLSRSLVSYQANKNEPVYRWFKYKEGFSSALVKYCLSSLSPNAGTLLDPFAGSGAALFASQEAGWHALGIELLPVAVYFMKARLSAQSVSLDEFEAAVALVSGTNFESHYRDEFAFQHIPITHGAFSRAAESQLAGYLAFCDSITCSPPVHDMLKFACFCVLEEISYTRKDGQYLRWDSRSPKKTTGRRFDKGRVPSFREAILRKLRRIEDDIAATRETPAPDRTQRGKVEVKAGSCLEILPAMRANSVDLVITSPPYCNRYDYTRTYALELAFLGYTSDQVKQLRQTLLSCTVENKEKVAELRAMYNGMEQFHRFQAVTRAFDGQAALQEVLQVLDEYRDAGSLNNSNVPRMVRNYFFEMAFVICELSRVLRDAGHVVMVNDNVRYAGEEVPVDLILSDIAARFGLMTKHIWVLRRGKGNSSQQMGCHGRRELRKCVYVWEKQVSGPLATGERRGRYHARKA